MTEKTKTSFLASLRQTLFTWIVDYEIFKRIFPHLEREKDFDYPFHSDSDVRDRVSESDIIALAQTVELRIQQMPKAYGEAFRFILHRDIHAKLSMYDRLACERVQPATCDPLLIATSAQ